MPFQTGLIHTETPPGVASILRLPMVDSHQPVPAKVDWFEKCPADGDPLGNDEAGNCTQVRKLRMIQIKRANAFGDTWKPSAQMALAMYEAEAGYKPGDRSTDVGTPNDVSLFAWEREGIRVNSQDLNVSLWLSVPRLSVELIKRAIARTGPVGFNVNLPYAMRDSPVQPWILPTDGSTTTFDWSPGSWGPHSAVLGAYDGNMFKVRTWGIDVPMDLAFLIHYSLSVDAMLDRQWFNAMGVSPDGTDYDTIKTELSPLRADDGNIQPV